MQILALCLLGIGFKFRHERLLSLLRISLIRFRPERTVSEVLFCIFTGYFWLTKQAVYAV